MRKKKEEAARESTLASGWKVEGEDLGLAAGEEPAIIEAAADALVDEAEQEPGYQGISNGALVLFGVFGGLYLLYTWGWFIIAQAYSEVNAFTAAGSGSIGGVLQQIVFWAAPLAPALWFFVSLAASRGGRTKRLAVLLCIGAVVLLPLPMLIARGG